MRGQLHGQQYSRPSLQDPCGSCWLTPRALQAPRHARTPSPRHKHATAPYLAVLVEKGRQANDHLVQHRAKTPPGHEANKDTQSPSQVHARARALPATSPNRARTRTMRACMTQNVFSSSARRPPRRRLRGRAYSPVHRRTIRQLPENLGRQVLWRATNGRDAVAVDVLLGQPVIT